MPHSSTTNSGPSVGSVPAVTGTRFLRASEPAIASTGTMSQNRVIHMTTPIEVA